MKASPTAGFALGQDRRALLQSLLRERRRGAAPAPVAIPRRAAEEPPCLSFGQERLWFVDVLQPGSWAYVIFHSLRLAGAINAEALEWAINEIVRRHEVLRSNFVAHDGEPRVVVAPTRPVPLRRIDLGHLPAAGHEAEVNRLLGEEAHAPFDLATDALLRVTMIALGPADHVLAIALHHIVSDAWSVDVFLRELFALYNAAAAGRPSPLPELPLQYGDYAAWQRRHLTGATLDRLLSYWRRQIAGAPALIPLPTDKPRPPVQSGAGARQGLMLRPAVVEPLRRIGRETNATLFMTLLAVFKVLLIKLCGEPHVVVGTPTANRSRTEIEGLIGFFVNTLVLHTDLSGDPTFREIVARVRDVTVGAYAHQDLPFEKLVEHLKPARSRAYNPLFQVMFNLQTGLRPVSASGADAETPAVDHAQIFPGAPKFDMEWALLELPAGMWATVEYSSDLYSATTIAELCRAYCRLAEAVTADPGARLSTLRLGVGAAPAGAGSADDFDFGGPQASGADPCS